MTSDQNRPLHSLNWLLIVGLAAIALIRPLFSMAGLSDALGKPATPLVLTGLISLAWILIVGLTRVRRPVLTLALAGLLYGVVATATSGMAMRGAPALIFGSASILITNLAWGAACGLLALLLQRLRGVR
ncbi:hypothetical protein SAMN05444920_12853 [Nonomuraea solani]|uniref:Uncharacterized protein n=1 Tax=Nonomuraea solani TaxID=1144553 RepID=A0A1H6F087_9ACTN|nr:hypothetical protein [Nonomuraea solani]SEH02626.1 hypothetical protein SAMN05444920_12853 [Nonomuraea solani]